MSNDFAPINCVNATNRFWRITPSPAACRCRPARFAVPRSGHPTRDGGTVAAAEPGPRAALGRIDRWLLLDFELPMAKNAKVSGDPDQGARQFPVGLKVREDQNRVTITNAAYTVALSKKEFSLFDSYRVKGKELIEPGADIVVEDLAGKRFYASNSRKIEVQVVETGPLRTVVEVRAGTRPGTVPNCCRSASGTRSGCTTRASRSPTCSPTGNT